MKIELDNDEARLLWASPFQRHGMDLLAIIRFRNSQAANLVLQRRTLQSETLGSAPFTGDASRCGSQSLDDYR